MARAALKIADEIWLAAALLHREHPNREDFAVQEIVERAAREKLAGGYRPGLQIHASVHCVATKPPNPARHRMLTETGRGRRRLFRQGDPYHPRREGGKIRPQRDDLLPRYAALIDWYEQVYSNGMEAAKASPLPPGTPGEALLKFVGRISPEDLNLMDMVIEEDCERVDPREWQLPD